MTRRSFSKTEPKIVVIGGGSGSFTVLSGLKKYTSHITAVVNMADDGGSSGRLRAEYGVQPAGDIRQCLVALSDTAKLQELFNFRFADGSLQGHAFGNIFLSALEKMTGSFAEAVEIASEVLAIRGRVEPVTLGSITLCMDDGGEVIRGEFAIGTRRYKAPQPRLWLEPSEAMLNPAVDQAISEADLIVVAPGNLYGTSAPALLVPGMKEALVSSPAKKVYVCNLVTKPGQTENFSVIDFANELERIIDGQFLDYVLYNTAKFPEELRPKYESIQQLPVVYKGQDADVHYTVVGHPLVAQDVPPQLVAADAIAHTRAFIRHDSDILAKHLVELIED